MVQRGAVAQYVLLVEDDFLLGTLVAEMLVDAGHTVIGPFPDTPQSLDALADRKVCAAILDINLRDGPCFRIAERLVSENIPLIFYTGHSAQKIPDAYCTYPIISKTAPPQILLATLEKLLKQASGDQRTA